MRLSWNEAYLLMFMYFFKFLPRILSSFIEFICVYCNFLTGLSFSLVTGPSAVLRPFFKRSEITWLREATGDLANPPLKML